MEGSERDKDAMKLMETRIYVGLKMLIALYVVVCIFTMILSMKSEDLGRAMCIGMVWQMYISC